MNDRSCKTKCHEEVEGNERRQEAMENEIEDGLKKFENDISKLAIRQK